MYDCRSPPPRRNGDVTAIMRSHKSQMLNSSLVERSQSPLLPPPCYCRKWLRERLIDFQLPYDLWWMHTNNMLPGRDLVPSWNYKKIKSSEFKLFDASTTSIDFVLKFGLRQGCVMSPWLFNVYMDGVVREVNVKPAVICR